MNRVSLPNTLVAVIISVLLVSSWSYACAETGDEQMQYDPAAEKLFQQALTEFKNTHYTTASKLFDSLIRFPEIHQRTTAAYIMQAKALFELNRFDSSLSVLGDLQNRFPVTTYTDDIEYTLGIDYMMLQQPRKAADHFIRVLTASADTALFRKGEELLNFIMRDRMDPPALTSLLNSTQDEEIKDLVALALIDHYRSTGEKNLAQKLISERLGSDTTSHYRPELVRMRKDVRTDVRFRVGVMLPLMSGSDQVNLQRLSGEMLDGIDFALKEFTGTVDPTSAITLDVRDVEMDSDRVVRTAQQWAQAPDMLCVIGPLFSSLVADAAPIANRYHLPMITPTATTNGLTVPGSYVFQLSPDYRTRGMAIADYAVGIMGMKNFIVLTTTEPMGKSGEGFITGVTALGGKIVASQSFPPGVTTLKDQALAIRQAVFGNDQDAQNFDLPATVDGIYLAIDDAEEIGIVIPQLAYFNIKGTLFGNNEWYDKDHLDSQRKLIDGLYLVSDTYLEDPNPRIAKFRAELVRQERKQPSKYTLIGYDVMHLILSCVQNGKSTREEFQACLSGVRGYQGLHSMITFSPRQVNSNLFLLQYHNGEIRKIADLGGP